MTLVNAERIKLASTRSPYWCLVAILVAGLGFAVINGLPDSGQGASIGGLGQQLAGERQPDHDEAGQGEHPGGGFLDRCGVGPRRGFPAGHLVR